MNKTTRLEKRVDVVFNILPQGQTMLKVINGEHMSARVARCLAFSEAQRKREPEKPAP
jgi:hypothetical protein